MATDKWNGNGNWTGNQNDWSTGAPPGTTAAGEIESGTADLTTAVSVATLLVDAYAELAFGSDASLTTSSYLKNSGVLSAQGDGDTLSIGGTLDNSGTLYIGYTGLAASTSVTAAGLSNTGYLALQGSAAGATTDQATLDIKGATPTTVTGTLRVLGDADLDLASSITAVGVNGFLQVDGSEARISVGSGTSSSALTGLAINSGTTNFDGNCALGAGGTSITTTTSFVNNGTLIIDYYGGDGATSVDFGGTLTNNGTAIIGNTSLGANAAPDASTTVTAAGLSNNGSLELQGNAATNATNLAVLDITGATSASVTGTLRVLGDADLRLTNAITSVGYGGFLQVDGAQARISIGSGTTSTALTGLSVNDGVTNFDGNCALGGGGTSITTTTGFTNAGTLWVDVYGGDGATTVKFGGAFNNTGTAIIGNTSDGQNAGPDASTSVTASGFSNSGTLELIGNAAGNATHQATLDITGTASTNVTGTLDVLGDADLQLANQFTSVGYAGFLQIDGAQARISLGSGTTNSALTGLAINAGTVLLRGDSGYGASGTSITTTTGLTNSGYLALDTYGGDGGSSVSLGGTLTNQGTTTVGNQGLSASTSLTATGLASSGTLTLQGNNAGNTTDQATVDITGKVAADVTGTVNVLGDADLELGSAITSVAYNSLLQIDGAEARVSLGSGTTNSALTGLTLVTGELLLRGDTGYGAGGPSITTTAGLATTGSLLLDAYGGDGGSTLTLGGVLTNDDYTDVGNQSLSAATTLAATGLSNNGSLIVQGNDAGGSTVQATVDVSGGVAAASSGYIRVGGDADLAVGSKITSVAGGSWLEVDGAEARISLGTGTTNSALTGLSVNDGIFQLRGDNNYGAGGTSITTTTTFTNADDTYVDQYGGDGGSTLTAGGLLTNNGYFDIGNASLSADTVVTAPTFSNNGSLILQGNAAGATTDQATLDITAGVPAVSTGYIRVGGDADYAVGSAITSVAGGSWLEVDGAEARVSLGTGTTNSALTGLGTNDGIFQLRGNTNFGAGGTSITTTLGFTNAGGMYVDQYNGDGGSTLAVGGVLNNDGDLFIGNAYLSALTTVTATGLSNNGSLIVQGNIAGGSTAQTTLDITGGVSAISTGYLRVSGDADMELGSKITEVAAGSWLELDGAEARISLGSGTSSSALTALSVNDGLLMLRGNTGFGSGGVSLTTTTGFTNHGSLYADIYNGDGGSTLSLGGTLTNNGAISIGNQYLSGSTTVTATALTNNGSIGLDAGNSYLGELVITGNATSIGSITIGGTSELDITGSHSFVQNAGTTTVTGLLVAPTIDVAGGLLDFTTALTAGDGTGALEIGSAGTLTFAGAVDSTHGVDFTAATGTLALGSPNSFAGTITGFSGTDVIDLQNTSVSGLSYSGNASAGTLTVTDSGGTAKLAFVGNYTTASFETVSDGNGGTEILDPPAHAKVTAATLKLPASASFLAAAAPAKLSAPTLDAASLAADPHATTLSLGTDHPVFSATDRGILAAAAFHDYLATASHVPFTLVASHF